jgi:hypothetical protein
MTSFEILPQDYVEAHASRISGMLIKKKSDFLDKCFEEDEEGTGFIS